MTNASKRLLTAALATLIASPALAHHPLAGAPMETLSDGILSGVGHPVLGFDHLFFVIAVGIAAVFTGRALTAPLGFIAGMLGGCALILAGVTLPLVELAIAASLLTTMRLPALLNFCRLCATLRYRLVSDLRDT